MLMMKIRDFEQEADLESKPLPFRDVERSDEGQYMCQVKRQIKFIQMKIPRDS